MEITTKTIRTDIRDIASRAADVIEARGHTKFMLEDDRGRVCLVGAILIAGGKELGWHYRDQEVADAVAEVIGVPKYLNPAAPGQYMYEVVGWNNALERTQAEVVGVLRRVASGDPAHVHALDM